LGGVLSGINEQNIKRFGRTTVKGEESSSGDGLLGTLASLLIAGSIGAMLLSSFWDKHIKPWLEEKVGIKLDVFDRFEGIVEGIGKFFTMGGLKIAGGWLFNLAGKAFTTFGDLLEGGLKAIFKLGFGDDVVKAGATAAPAAWKTLIPKIAGGLFRGMGAVAFKTIPIIGSLISFYYAWDRFEKGDTIAGIIDLVGGISNLLVFTPLAPLALPLSIGASALNAFLDYKAGRGATMDEKQNIKMDWINKITDSISNIPFIGGMISSIVGFVEFGSGIVGGNMGAVKGGLLKMTKFPLFGVFPSVVLSLLEASTNSKNEFVGLDFNKFISKFRQDTLKTVLSWFPTWFNMRNAIAEFMGIKLDGEYADSPSIQTESTPEQIRLRAEIEKKQKESFGTPYEKGSAMEKEASKVDDDKIKELTTRLNNKKNELSVLLKKINSSRFDPDKEDNDNIDRLKRDINGLERVISRVEKKDDFSFKSLMTSTEGNSILFDKNTNTANVLHPDDNVLAYKTGGVFDTALKELTLLVQSINKGIYKIPESLENNKSKPSNVSVVNNSGGSNGNMLDVILSGTRPDSIYNFRRSIQGEFT
jgi:hypothetical protein